MKTCLKGGWRSSLLNLCLLIVLVHYEYLVGHGLGLRLRFVCRFLSIQDRFEHLRSGLSGKAVSQSGHQFTALNATPSLSLVLPFESLFDEDEGIFANSENSGRDWERPVSVELIYPPCKGRKSW